MKTAIQHPILSFDFQGSISCSCVYNLFSNFGNISCITLKKDKVYIKFRTKEFSAIASSYLNRTVLFGNIIDLKECSSNSFEWKPIEGEYSESIYYDSQYDR